MSTPGPGSSSSSPSITAQVSFAIVGATSGTSRAFNSTVGDALLVFVAEHSSATVSSVSDTLGNAFKQVGPSGYLTNSQGPERVTIFASYNLSQAGSDRISVSTSSYAWTVAVGVEVTHVGPSPLDAQGSYANSSQSGQSTTPVQASVFANASDLVLMVGGVRGAAYENATGGDVLVASNASASPYNAEQAGVFDRTQNASSGRLTLGATNSNRWAAWVADAIALKPGTPYAPGPGIQSLTFLAHQAFSFQGTSATSASFRSGTKDLLLVFVSVGSTQARVTSVNDTQGDRFQSLSTVNLTQGGAAQLSIWDATNVSSAIGETASIGVNRSAAGVVNLIVLHGVNASRPLDGLSVATQGNGSRTISNSVTANLRDCAILGVSEAGPLNVTPLFDNRIDQATGGTAPGAITGATLYANATANQQTLQLEGRLAAPSAWLAESVVVRPANATLPHPIQHVVTIVLENRAYYQVLGHAPYQAYLAGQYASATHAYSLCHPSLADYLALGAGNAFGTCDLAMNASVVRNTISANASDLLLMVGGIRGPTWVNASGGDSLVEGNVSSSPYNTETAAVFSQSMGLAGGSITLKATNSNHRSPWVAGGLAVRGSAQQPNVNSHTSFVLNGTPNGTSRSLVTTRSDTILVFVAEHSNASVSSVSDSLGDSFHQLGAGGSYLGQHGPERVSIYASTNLSRNGSDRVSVTTSTYSWTVVIVLEIGHVGASPIDSVAPFTNGSYDEWDAGVWNSPNVGDLVDAKGGSWMGYLEGMPSACATTDSGTYLTRHNPFVHYANIVQNSTRCSSHVVNSRYFNQSVANGTLPEYAYYAPNAVDDCHSSTLPTCDAWLKGFLAPLLNSSSSTVRALVNHTLFLIVYDESLDNDTAGYGPLGAHAGGHIYLVAVSPYSKSRSFVANASIISLLSTVEWLFDLGVTANFDGTNAYPPMARLFSFTSNGY